MSETPDPKGPPDCPRLIFNSDGDSTTYIAFEPPITPEQACRDIEEVAGTAVEVFTNSMGRGDETFSHPTGFGEIYGSNVTEWPQAEGLEYVRWMADSTLPVQLRLPPAAEDRQRCLHPGRGPVAARD